MSEYKYEAETFEIAGIRENIKQLQERIQRFCEHIETEDSEKLQKQVNAMLHTSTRIYKHLSSLNTKEDLQAFRDKLTQEQRAKKVAALLQNANFLEYVKMNECGITNEDIVAFQQHYNVRLHEEGRGTWRWLALHDLEGNRISTEEDLCKFGIRIPRAKEAMKRFKEEFLKEKEGLLEENEKEDHPYDHYGWVLPNGEFIPSDFGTHEESAIELVKKMDWEKEQRESGVLLCRDFLIQKKNYVLLHNPTGFGATIVTHMGRETKAQRETLYDYFTHQGDNYMANQYLEAEYDR